MMEKHGRSYRFRRAPLALLLFLTVSWLILSLASYAIDAYSTIATYYYPKSGVTVRYSKLFLKPAEITVVLEDEGGKKLPGYITLYSWLPNGSMRLIGVYASRNGVYRLDYTRIAETYISWKKHLEENYNDPSSVDIGLVLLAVVQENGALYPALSIIPLNPKLVSAKTSIEVKALISVDKAAKIATIEEVEKRAKEIVAEEKNTPATGSFPPEKIREECTSHSHNLPFPGVCYVWILDNTYYSAIDKPVPLVMARVHGAISHVYNIILREKLRVIRGTTSYIGFYSVFGITYQGVGPIISFEVKGPIFSLREDRTYLDEYRFFYRGTDFNDDAILAIGVRGDIAFAKYKLYSCFLTVPSICSYEGKDSLASFIRPRMRSNHIVPWSGVDNNPYDGQGLLEKIFNMYWANWNHTYPITSYGSFLRDNEEILYLVDTTPAISVNIASLAVLASLVENPWLAILASGLLSATAAGVNTENVNTYIQEFLLEVGLSTNAGENYNVLTKLRYTYSPGRLLLGDNKYYVGSMYMDINVEYRVR